MTRASSPGDTARLEPLVELGVPGRLRGVPLDGRLPACLYEHDRRQRGELHRAHRDALHLIQLDELLRPDVGPGIRRDDPPVIDETAVHVAEYRFILHVSPQSVPG